MPDLRFLRNGWGKTGKARPTPRKHLQGVVRYMYHAWLHRLHWRMYHGLFNLAVQMWWWVSQFASVPCPFCGVHHFDPLLPSTSIYFHHWSLTIATGKSIEGTMCLTTFGVIMASSNWFQFWKIWKPPTSSALASTKRHLALGNVGISNWFPVNISGNVAPAQFFDTHKIWWLGGKSDYPLINHEWLGNPRTKWSFLAGNIILINFS